jgi:hypothetical protein
MKQKMTSSVNIWLHSKLDSKFNGKQRSSLKIKKGNLKLVQRRPLRMKMSSPLRSPLPKNLQEKL